MILTKDKGLRMWGGEGSTSVGGAGGSGSQSLSGYATQDWVTENFLSIEFFSKLFKAYGPAETEGDPDVEIVPNDVEGTISNIQAMFGFWTEQYISALGQGSGGGGGGGDLNEPLASINTAGLATHPGSAGQTIIWNGSAWVYGSVLNSGVTSVGLSAPTGFNVTGSPITTSGTLALSFASGYELPLAADTAKGVTAYGWGDHSLAGYALASNVYSKTDADAKFLTIAFFRSLFKAYTSASAEVVPNAGDTTTISSIKAMFGFWTEQYISALGQGSGGGGGITLNEPLASLNNAGLAAPSSAGQTLVWNGSAWKYSNAAGISTTSLNVGGSSSISGALSVAGNITTSAGGFIVNGKDNTYVLLAGGGTKLLSEIGGGGAVNSITIGQSATVYPPDANGNVNIPAYPTVPSSIVEQIVIAGTSTPYQPSSGTVTLPTYPTVPTTISSFTNDSGYITNAALTGYLPLTGGTMSGTINSNNIIPTANNTYKLGSNSKGYQVLYTLYVNGISNSELILASADGDRDIYITAGHNIAIGHQNPSYKLDINGTLGVNSAATLSGGLHVSGVSTNTNDDDGICVYQPDRNHAGITLGNRTVYGDTENKAIITEIFTSFYDLTSNWAFTKNGSTKIINHPYKDGTIALISDIPSDYVTLTTTQTISGNKTFSSPVTITGWSNASYGLSILTSNNNVGVIFGNKTESASDTFVSELYSKVNTKTSYWSTYNGTSWYEISHPNKNGVVALVSDISSSLLDYVTLATDQTISGGKTFSKGILITGRMSSSRDDDGLRIISSSLSYIGLTMGNQSTVDSNSASTEIYINISAKTAHWYLQRGTSSYTIQHPNKNGIIAITTDLDNYLPLAGGTMTGAITSQDIIPTTTNAYKLGSNSKQFFVLYTQYVNSAANSVLAIASNDGDRDIYITAAHNIAMGHKNPSYKLDVSGVIYSNTGVYSAGYVTALSDIRKKNVREYMEMDYGIVADAPMIKFTWKDGRCDGKLQVGSIAQYWQRALPEAVSEMADGELSMSYGVIALLSSIATARKVREHEKRIAELERENKELKQRLNAA